MSSEPPPGSGEQPPEDDPFKKRHPSEQGPGSPYDTPPGGTEPPPSGGTEPPRYGGGPYGGPPGGSPYGGGPGAPYPGGPYGAGGPQGGGYPGDPLAGMPPLADTGRRIAARLIDLILVGILAFLVLLPLWLSVSESDTDLTVTGKSFAATVVSTVLYVAYDTLTTAKWGQTLGKKLLSLRVANLADGSAPTARTSFVRALVLWGPSVVPCCLFSLWWIVSSSWSFFDKPYRQGIHDKAARTVVVSTS